jgi:archaemetzincin
MQRVAVPVLALLVVAGAAALAVRRPKPEPPPAPAAPAPEAPSQPEHYLGGPIEEVPHLGVSVERALALGKKLEPLQTPAPAASGTDWLVWHLEPGQTLRQFIRSDPNRPTRARTTIYVVPLGEFDEARRPLLDAASEALGLFFGVPVKRLVTMPLSRIKPDDRREHEAQFGEQLYTEAVLDLLTRRRPDDALAMIALTTSDLWPGGEWNYVFGQASLEQRVGVWSVARFGDPAKDGKVVVRRTIQTALHETGHMLGILHCIFNLCGMAGANNLAESDRQPMHFCAEDEMKIFWAFPAEPVARYRALATFAGKYGLDEEARFWSNSAEAVAR